MITGLKDVSELRVGDTLTSEARPAAGPLPGYKDVKPMVFAGSSRRTPTSTPSCATRSRS